MTRRHSILIVLTVAAWMCRALIPPGFMPQMGDHFAVQLKICPGHAHQAPGTGQGEQPRPDQLPASDQPCVYSAGVASAPPAHTFEPSTHLDSLLLAVVVDRSADMSGIFARAQSARGPPLLI
jgi:hypothetical protein